MTGEELINTLKERRMWLFESETSLYRLIDVRTYI